MSSILVVTWDGAGNQLPTLGLARHLVRAGHDVRLLGHASIEERSGAHGWRFRPFVHTTDFRATREIEPGRETELLSRDLWFNAGVADDVREELAHEPADVVVVDCMLLCGLSAAQAAGVPTVALFHTPMSGFRGGPMVEMLAPGIEPLNACRADLGLAPVASMAEVHDACALSLVATFAEFEMDIPMPANARFVGPILDGPALSLDGDELPIEDGPDPLVLVSFSTSDQGQLGVLRGVVDELGELPVKVVVTTGPAIAPEEIAAPANTVVTRFVDHRQVLPRTSAVVTHAGLGTVMAALAHGVPMVCVPMGRDQFYNAATVERLGAGVTVAAEAEAGAIGDALRGVLDASDVAAAAKHLAGIVAGSGGGAEAVREVEGLVG